MTSEKNVAVTLMNVLISSSFDDKKVCCVPEAPIETTGKALFPLLTCSDRTTRVVIWLANLCPLSYSQLKVVFTVSIHVSKTAQKFSEVSTRSANN